MHAKSINVEVMIGTETDEVIEELFKYFLQKYREGLEESIRGSKFVYDSVDALYYNLNKVSLSSGGSYMDSPKWLKNKKATINPNNDEQIMNKLKKIPKEYQKLNHLLINTIGKRHISQHIVKILKNLNQTINQLLLIFCMCLIILKK